MPGRGRGSQRSLQTTTNVVTVRNYVAGDALTRIHWPTTARLGQLMVKEFDLDPTIDVVVLLDLDRQVQAGDGDSSTEEYGVTIAASLSAYLLRQQELSVALSVNGVRDASLALDRGERQLDRILEVLAVVHPQQAMPLAQAIALEDARLSRNTVLVVITSSTELEWTQVLYQVHRRGVHPFVIALDPQTFDDRLARESTRSRTLCSRRAYPFIHISRGDPLVHVLEQGPS